MATNDLIRFWGSKGSALEEKQFKDKMYTCPTWRRSQSQDHSTIPSIACWFLMRLKKLFCLVLGTIAHGLQSLCLLLQSSSNAFLLPRETGHVTHIALHLQLRSQIMVSWLVLWQSSRLWLTSWSTVFKPLWKWKQEQLKDTFNSAVMSKLQVLGYELL